MKTLDLRYILVLKRDWGGILSGNRLFQKGGKVMTKAELTAFVADKAGITKKAAEAAINAFADGVSSALEKGESVSLLGFGSFKVAERAEREGRNPRTGEKIKIPAAKVAKFAPGKALKDRIK